MSGGCRVSVRLTLVRWPRTFTGLGPLKWFDGG
jgi:hypothetical protein